MSQCHTSPFGLHLQHTDMITFKVIADLVVPVNYLQREIYKGTFTSVSETMIDVRNTMLNCEYTSAFTLGTVCSANNIMMCIVNSKVIMK